MTALGWLALVSALSTAVTLAATGGHHFLRYPSFRQELSKQGYSLMDRWWFGIVVAGTEVALGVGIFVGILAQDRRLGAACLLGAMTLLLGFAVFTSSQLRKHPGVPCACDVGPSPANRWSVSRALTLAGVSLLGALRVPADAPVSADLVTAVLAAVAMALLLWSLPLLMDDDNIHSSLERAPA